MERDIYKAHLVYVEKIIDIYKGADENKDTRPQQIYTCTPYYKIQYRSKRMCTVGDVWNSRLSMDKGHLKLLSTEYKAVLYIPIVVRNRGKEGNEAAGRERIHAKYVRY